MAKKFNLPPHASTALKTNIIFLSGYFCILCLSAFFHMTALLLATVFVMLYYLILFPVCLRTPRRQLQFVYVGNLLYMIAAVLITGWSYGFQLQTFFVTASVTCFCYLAKNIDPKVFYIPFFAGVYFIAYICLRFYCFYFPPLYEVQNSMVPLIFSCFHVFMVTIELIYYQYLLHTTIYHTEENLIDTSEKDALTQLFNRRKIQSVLELEFNRCKDRYSSISVALLDIDDFKKVNDTYGHNTGDSVLKEISAKLSALQSKSLVCGRWGGEEFLIICTENIPFSEFVQMLEHLREDISNVSFQHEEENFSVTVTMGATCSSNETEAKQLVALADELMYYGKRHGKNCVVSK